MGCCGSKSTYGIDPQDIEPAVQRLRQKYGSELLIMAVKDQNVPGKLCLCGNVTSDLAQDISSVLKSDEKNKEVMMMQDEYDKMWSHSWHKTRLTTGHTTFSLQKSYFPRGQLFVKLLDTIAKHGWSLSCAANFGGVESRDDNGHPTSTVDWPTFIFYKEPESQFTNEHLMLAVKDSNIPGKLCAAGPLGGLESKMTAALQPHSKDVKSEKDSYDDDWDVVWRNTSITTGALSSIMGKMYFPKGKTNIGLLECCYSEGWRCVAAPNFGGQGDSWPCYVLRKLKDPVEPPPELLFASIKDSNIPGKLCMSGRSADEVTDAVCGALTQGVPDNTKAHSEKDGYDEDHDAVARDVHVTTGMQAFSLRVAYFPRGDSMNCVLNTWAQEGFQVAACPNFGGMCDSWPTFVLEKKDSVPPPLYLGVKDDNIPGKVVLTGGGIGSNGTIGGELLDVFQSLCGPNALQALDDYDRSYELAFRNTVLTTGHATFTFQKPYWPHGYVVEMMLQVLLKHGFKAQGGPNFGNNGNQWPGMVFYKEA